ncbi:MAG: glycosyltransferase family 2 protein [Muribaculaceae bacterium]|nr:glycosyltransferase family 2 protein [Muribaculaceae bacterium]
MNPKASIIILTYNQESTIARAIESVLRQRCRYPFEILLADDCSPDGTRGVAARYAEEYPDIVRLMPEHPNRGLVDNYFDALQECRGEYIGDCAGDDEWLDDTRLERQIEILDGDQTLSVVFTDVEELTIDKDGKRHSRLNSSREDCRRWMRDRISGEEITIGVLDNRRTLPFVLSSALYRKSALAKTLDVHPELVRIPEMGVEDVPVIAALGRGGDAKYIPVAGYRYYIDGESVSNNLSNEKEYSFYRRVLLGTSGIASGYGISASRLKGHYDMKLSHIAAQARHAGRKDLIPEIEATAKLLGTTLPLRAKLHLLLLRLGIYNITVRKKR